MTSQLLEREEQGVGGFGREGVKEVEERRRGEGLDVVDH